MRILTLLALAIALAGCAARGDEGRMPDPAVFGGGIAGNAPGVLK